jgi:large subunit ribosomal protein L6
MSRIGKKPVAIPAGVKVEVGNGEVTVTGKKGTIRRLIPGRVSVEVQGGAATVAVSDDGARNLFGMYRTLLSNMVQGVTAGYAKTLEIVGIGYKAEKKPRALQLSLGFSHPVVFPLPEGIDAELESPTVIRVTGTDKELVGETAAQLRRLRPPDVYKNKGIRYRGERLIKKVGKAAGK